MVGEVNRRALCAALLGGVVWGGTTSVARAQVPPWMGGGKPALPRGAPTPAPTFREIDWNSLMPPGWDPMQGFRGVDMNSLDDKDPKATELLKKMREAWDRAPVNMALIGQPVRIAGYVVPLEESSDGLKEFLLVPHFGACIHTPPPPANQIVHVLPRSAAKGVRSMSTVAVKGVLAYTRNDSYMGTSSWRLEAVSVEPLAEGASTAPLR